MTHESTLTLQLVQNAALPMIGSSLRSADGVVLWLESDPHCFHLVASPGHPLLTAFSGETKRSVKVRATS